jgi:hypothetical protein
VLQATLEYRKAQARRADVSNQGIDSHMFQKGIRSSVSCRGRPVREGRARSGRS